MHEGEFKVQNRVRPAPYFGSGLLITGASLVAQVFVANPNKTPKITELLQHNKDKLLRYLGGLPHGQRCVQYQGCRLCACGRFPDTLTGPPKPACPAVLGKWCSDLLHPPSA